MLLSNAEAWGIIVGPGWCTTGHLIWQHNIVYYTEEEQLHDLGEQFYKLHFNTRGRAQFHCYGSPIHSVKVHFDVSPIIGPSVFSQDTKQLIVPYLPKYRVEFVFSLTKGIMNTPISNMHYHPCGHQVFNELVAYLGADDENYKTKTLAQLFTAYFSQPDTIVESPSRTLRHFTLRN